VDVVTVDEIYDNFSGGVPDPVAIRNYCKFLYDNFSDTGGNPLLTYLLLLGDANVDFKNFTTSLPNFVTTNVNMNQLTLDAYITDDWFALMDPADVAGAKFIDFAVGRLPAASAQEADALVSKVISYETTAEFGAWRDQVILVADDEVAFRNDRQADFVIQSEVIASSKLAKYLNPLKIYLTEFPAISGIKPASRLFFLDAWNEGALVVNYVGHGSSKQMADEQVFLDTDVPNLVNGLRLPLLVAVSCTIGKFGDGAKSLSEKLLLRDGGGVIATVTASELTFIGPNASFDFNLFESLFPASPGPAEPLGVALMTAKFRSLSASGLRLVEENNEKYNLLGDPALRLLSPQRRIVFAPVDIDTLVTGRREMVHGSVYGGGQVDTGFSGTVRLVVREPDDQSGYQREDGFSIPYNYPGGTVYEGTADVRAGEFEFNFKVPRSAQTGDLGFILGYADNGVTDAAARFDSILYVPASPGDSTALVPLDGPPRVTLGFQGGASTVKPGAVLQARIRDADGVNILTTTPEGKIALVFDRSNLPIDATRFFDFDHGGVDTSGTLLFPVPGLAVGEHSAVLKVADSFGQTRLDTLEFSVTDVLDFSAEVVLNYPNPFRSSTHFLVNLTGRARIRLDIFTLSGRRIRTLETTRDPGEAWILWDGRDFSGDTIGNGAYLYVATVDFEGVSRPALVLRGKLVKVE
ncbi:MAG: C25 family cysteine peptidase, partial [Candidatus Krumholzibacteriia bacterium]